MLNPCAPCCFVQLCALSRIQREGKRTFLIESLDSSWTKKPLLWKLKLNTFLPTTPGCLKECSTFLSQRREHPLPSPCLPATSKGTHTFRHPTASAPEDLALWCCFRAPLTQVSRFHFFNGAIKLSKSCVCPRHNQWKDWRLHVWNVTQINMEA